MRSEKQTMWDQPDEMRIEAGELIGALEVVHELPGGQGGDAQQEC